MNTTVSLNSKQPSRTIIVENCREREIIIVNISYITGSPLETKVFIKEWSGSITLVKEIHKLRKVGCLINLQLVTGKKVEVSGKRFINLRYKWWLCDARFKNYRRESPANDQFVSYSSSVKGVRKFVSCLKLRLQSDLNVGLCRLMGIIGVIFDGKAVKR